MGQGSGVQVINLGSPLLLLQYKRNAIGVLGPVIPKPKL